MEQFNVTGMSCAACSARVEKAVKSVPGVTGCSVSLLTNSMGVEGTAEDAAIIHAVEQAGYGASPKKAAVAASTSAELDALADHETPKLKRRLIASLGFLLVLMYFSMGHMMWGWPLPRWFDSNHIAMGLVQLLLAEFIVGAVALVIVEVFPLQIAMLFGAANESAYYADFTVKCFRTYLCLMPLATLNKGTFIYLQALGKAFASTAVSMTREIIFGVSLPVILPVFFGLDGLLWSFPAADLLTFLIAVFFIRQTYRELSDVSAVHTEEET